MELHPLCETSVARVALAMRAADRAEIFACRWRYDPVDLTRHIVALSRLGAVASSRGQPIAVINAVELVPGLMSLGMFATNDWALIARPFTRWCHTEFRQALLQTGGRRAEAWSHTAHTQAHRWLRGFGFQPETGPLMRGRSGERFILFGWERDDAAL